MTKYGRQTQNALKGHQLAPKKRLGQNFLVNRNTAEAIVRAGNVTATDIILEVGVGLGALTTPLAAAVQHVFGYEIDSGIIRFHEEEGDLPANVTLVHQDILTADFQAIAKQCGGSLKILANLPYSISNPFIFKLIDNAPLIDCATIMLQKEVADRLTALPSSKDYGVPTVLLACCARVKKLMTLKPAEFHPRPKIDSVVIHIDFATHRKLAEGNKGPSFDFSLLKKIVRTTFNQRRKTILNTLSHSDCLGIPGEIDHPKKKQLTENAILAADLSPAARPETLTVADFIGLSRAIQQLQ
ncbi:MAG: 16S rRNA (adenine(1518)-N(6)/adenine(1519)-N(6))-dimethyltransferase RsmA [Desulforhopalus sp.]|nr:16S rRNA (adenine(1518)-N(6)/adenine(1519)-N(6))-dimethyltransferase RsmA [Desulforhopalus sp.]